MQRALAHDRITDVGLSVYEHPHAHYRYIGTGWIAHARRETTTRHIPLIQHAARGSGLCPEHCTHACFPGPRISPGLRCPSRACFPLVDSDGHMGPCGTKVGVLRGRESACVPEQLAGKSYIHYSFRGSIRTAFLYRTAQSSAIARVEQRTATSAQVLDFILYELMLIYMKS